MTSALDWNPAKATTSDWGAERLAGRPAPAEDIAGKPRIGRPDLGAFESGALSKVPPDGTFRIEHGDGAKSAGLFRGDGSLIRYLFQDLPLPVGTHEFILPSRTELGDRNEPGRYEVRVVEGNLSWAYRRMVGNNGVDNSTDNSDQFHNWMLAFAPGNEARLILASGWSERGVNLRCLGLDDRKARWTFGGSADIRGLALDPQERVYLVRGTEKVFSLVRLEARSGRLIPWEPSRPIARLESTAAPASLAVLGDSLYLAVPENNLIEVLDAATARKTRDISVPKPMAIAADRRRGCLWVISDHQTLLAIGTDGKVHRTIADVPSPLGLAIRGNRLAVASYQTGKVHVFDIEGDDPASMQISQKRTVGRGDGPYGPILADRFWFQKGMHTSPAPVSIDINEAGDLAIRDVFSRVIVFNDTGKILLHTFSQFGNAPFRAPFGDSPSAPTRFLDFSGTVSWTIDAQAGTWAPEAYWGHPTSELAREFRDRLFRPRRPSIWSLPTRLEGAGQPDARWRHRGPVREPRRRAGRILHPGTQVRLRGDPRPKRRRPDQCRGRRGRTTEDVQWTSCRESDSSALDVRRAVRRHPRGDFPAMDVQGR